MAGASDFGEVERTRLQRRLERERQARSESEAIGERALRELYKKQQEMELLRAVAVAANESSSIQEVMQICLDRICAHTGWPVGHVYVLAEDGTGELTPTTIWHLEQPARFETFRTVTEASRFSPGVGLPGRVLATGKPVWIMDVTQDPNFPRAKVATDIGVRAGFGFPVWVGTAVVAVLEFFSPEAVEPDEPLLDVMAHIGAQLGRVIERTRAEGVLRESEERYRRLYDEAQAREREATKLYEITSQLAASLDVDRILDLIVEKAVELLGCDALGIMRYDDAGGGLRFVRASGLSPEEMRQMRVKPGEGIAGRAFQQGRVVWTQDLGAMALDKEYSDASTARLVQARAPRGAAAAPIVSHGEVFGVLGVYVFVPRDFTPREIQLVSTLADQAAIALENARLYQEAQTQRRKAEAASRAKSEFLANMSHEMRTPLNAILGMADLLDETALPAQQREYVRLSRGAGETLLTLIDDILDLSTMEAGQMALAEIEFDLGELVETTAAFLAMPAHEKGLELVCQVRPDVPTGLVGDAQRLRQLLIHLLGNAIKFTEQGEVVLRVEPDPEMPAAGALHFAIADTGIGIPPEQQETIFERFTQADASATRKHGGTGLGLAISKRLVELMGGRFWVDSQVGHGSTFHVTARFGLQAVPTPRRPPPPVDLQGMRVLIIDDNAANRLILQEMLASWGSLVTAVGSGEAGLAELQRAQEAAVPYRLLLLDGRMPGMDGFQVAERIKTTPTLADVIMVLLTSDPQGGDIVRGRNLGLAGYLAKPIKRAALLETITAALGPTHVAAAERLPVASPAPPEAQRTLRILLVEDSADNRALIQSYLKSTSYQLEMAENGAIALDKVRAGPYDLVLMDMQMPVMDGYSATKAIRVWEREQGVRATPILALTAHALPEDVHKSLEAGCTAHLSKPIKKATLLAAIDAYARTP